MNKSRKNFVLTAADSIDVYGHSVSALEVVLARLKDCRWGMYKNTRNKGVIATGDRLCIYASGQRAGGMSFIGTATVGNFLQNLQWRVSDFNNHYLAEPPIKLFELTDVVTFTKPLKIKDVRDSLSFIPTHAKWGVVMYGGCRQISDDDFELIVRASKYGK
jgi:predicted RNA-binding protein